MRRVVGIFGLAMSLACGAPGKPTPARPEAPDADDCAPVMARVEQLRREGRLDRAIRTIEGAGSTCAPRLARVREELRTELGPPAGAPLGAPWQNLHEADDALTAGDAERALAAYEAALEIQPWNPQALTGAGLAAKLSGREAIARRRLDQARAAYAARTGQPGQVVQLQASYVREPLAVVTAFPGPSPEWQVALRRSGHRVWPAWARVSDGGTIETLGSGFVRAGGEETVIFDDAGHQVSRIEGHVEVQVSSDGSRALAMDREGSVLYALPAWNEIARSARPEGEITLSSDGRTLLADEDGGPCRLIELPSFARKAEAPGLHCLASLSANRLVSFVTSAQTYENGTLEIQIWSIHEPKKIATHVVRAGHSMAFVRADVGPHGRRLAFWAGGIGMIDLASGRLTMLERNLPLATTPRGPHFSRDGEHVCVVDVWAGNKWILPPVKEGDESLHCHAGDETGGLVRMKPTRRSPIGRPVNGAPPIEALHHATSTLAAAEETDGGAVVTLVDTRTGEHTRVLEAKTAPADVRDLEFVRDGSIIRLETWGDVAEHWAVDTGEALPSGHPLLTDIVLIAARPWRGSAELRGATVSWKTRGAAQPERSLWDLSRGTRGDLAEGVERGSADSPLGPSPHPAEWSKEGEHTVVVLKSAKTGSTRRLLLEASGFREPHRWSRDGDDLLFLLMDYESGEIRVHRLGDGALLATFLPTGPSSALAFLDGAVERLGPPGPHERLACRFGDELVPFEVCEERSLLSGAVEKALAGPG